MTRRMWDVVAWRDAEGDEYKSEEWDYHIDNPAKARTLAAALPNGYVVAIQHWGRFKPFGSPCESDNEVGPPTVFSNRRVKLVIEIEASILDPAWTEDDLVSNGVEYLISMIDDGQKNNMEREGFGAYWFDNRDLTLWTIGAYTADLEDLAAT